MTIMSGRKAGHMRERVVSLIGTVCTGQTARCGSVATDAFIPFIRAALSRLIVAISHDIASG
jgi:hypothetical protein